jgi:hypothetical protein
LDAAPISVAEQFASIVKNYHLSEKAFNRFFGIVRNKSKLAIVLLSISRFHMQWKLRVVKHLDVGAHSTHFGINQVVPKIRSTLAKTLTLKLILNHQESRTC